MRNASTESLADTINKHYIHANEDLAVFISMYPGAFDLRDNGFFLIVDGQVAHCYFVDGQFYVKY